jgi:hypothetical protein
MELPSDFLMRMQLLIPEALFFRSFCFERAEQKQRATNGSHFFPSSLSPLLRQQQLLFMGMMINN